MQKARFTWIVAVLFLAGGLVLSGCTNLTPLNPPSPYSSPPPSGQDYTVTYNYSDTGPVQLSANNIVLTTGQKLILQPAPGLTSSTRFVSSGDNFFGDIMKQDGDPQTSGKAVFTAIKQGKGKLQIVPNTTETDRAIDFWVTVQ